MSNRAGYFWMTGVWQKIFHIESKDIFEQKNKHFPATLRIFSDFESEGKDRVIFLGLTC